MAAGLLRQRWMVEIDNFDKRDEVLVFLCIAFFASDKDGRAVLSKSEIVRRCLCSHGEVDAIVEKLKERRLIDIQPFNSKSDLYIVRTE